MIELFAGLAGFGLGFGTAAYLWYIIAVKPLANGYVRLRYDGFRAEAPPQRPKTVPLPPRMPRED